MKSFRLIALAIIFMGTVGIQNAKALSLDNETMTNRDGSAKFSDPDDKVEANFGGSNSQVTDPNYPGHVDSNQIAFRHLFSNNNDDSKPVFFTNLFSQKK